MNQGPQGYSSANSHTHSDSFSFPFLPLGHSNMFFKYIIINNIFSMIKLSYVPTKLFLLYLLSPVILNEGRIFLKPLSTGNNLETQMVLRTLTSSRVAGDCDFTEGQGLSWTQTDPNSPFRTTPIFLNFHGPLLQQVSFVLVPCGTGMREAGIRIMTES